MGNLSVLSQFFVLADICIENALKDTKFYVYTNEFINSHLSRYGAIVTFERCEIRQLIYPKYSCDTNIVSQYGIARLTYSVVSMFSTDNPLLYSINIPYPTIRCRVANTTNIILLCHSRLAL